MNHRQSLKTLFIFATLGLIPCGAIAQQPQPTQASMPYATASGEITLSEAKIVGGLSHESGARLMDPVAVDFDGDGLDDLVFAAPGMSPYGVRNAGSVYVLLGKKDDDLTGRRDMTLWQSFDYRFDGMTTNGQLGMNMVTGDFNGDGLKDIAISEPGQNGRIYVINSGKKLDRGYYSILDERVTDVYFAGAEGDSNLGIQMCVGDFNHDDIEDIAASYVTSTSASSLTSTTTNVILLTMRRSWDTKYHNISGKLYGKTIFSRSTSKNVKTVYTCAAGDFNDDGLMDIALGMPFDTFDNQKTAGSVSIVYYPFKYSGTTVNLSEAEPSWGIRIKGSQPGAMFGYSLAAGDFTSDGRTDLAVSAPNRLIKNANAEGAVYVIDASKWPQNSVVQPEDLRIVGKGGQFGFKLAAQDVNRDKRPDLIVSAPYADIVGAPNAGTINVYLGGPQFIDSVKSEMRPDVFVSGDQNMNLGFGAAFGDFNGDEKNDVIARTTRDPDDRPNTGAYVVINDALRMTPDTRLEDNPFLTIVAPSQGGTLADHIHKVHYNHKDYHVWFSKGGMGNRSVICMMDAAQSEKSAWLFRPDACDINIIGPENTPIQDVLLTSNDDGSKTWLTLSLPSFKTSKAIGVVTTIVLPSEITKPLTLNLSESTLKSEAISFVLNGEIDAKLGAKIEMTDIDRDGKLDLLIGAPIRSIDKADAGSFFIVKDVVSRNKGIYSLTEINNVLTIEGIDDENLGSDWQILDFNLDGHLDLVLLSQNTKNIYYEVYATAYVFYDIGHQKNKIYNATSPEIAPLKIVAPQPRSNLRFTGQMPDLNNDGNPDIVLISPDYRAGLQRQGAVYALFASKERKSGTLSLNNEALVNFSLVPNRNEKLSDVRFAYIDGTLQLVLLADSMLTRKSSLKRFVTGEKNMFSGQLTFTSLKRMSSDIMLNENARFLYLPDPELKQDDLWLLFPNAGESQSDQGIAHRLTFNPR